MPRPWQPPRRAVILQTDSSSPEWRDMQTGTWFAILVPLLVLGWLIAQVMPTPRDRQLQRLRARARELELTVTLRRLRDPDPEATARVSGAGRPRDAQLELAAYALPLRLPGDLGRHLAPRWSLVFMHQHPDELYLPGLPRGWRLEQADMPLREAVVEKLAELLTGMPAGTAALEGSATGAILSWRERGGPEEVDRIADVLAAACDFELAQTRLAAAREGGGASRDGR
jgi:hypothetical protein